jgi:hypothetical protein
MRMRKTCSTEISFQTVSGAIHVPVARPNVKVGAPLAVAAGSGRRVGRCQPFRPRCRPASQSSIPSMTAFSRQSGTDAGNPAAASGVDSGADAGHSTRRRLSLYARFLVRIVQNSDSNLCIRRSGACKKSISVRRRLVAVSNKPPFSMGAENGNPG